MANSYWFRVDFPYYCLFQHDRQCRVYPTCMDQASEQAILTSRNRSIIRVDDRCYRPLFQGNPFEGKISCCPCSDHVVCICSIFRRISSLLYYRLLPIAATIPPATLSVASIAVPYVVQRVVPSLQTNVNREGWTVNRDYRSSPWKQTRLRNWYPTPSVRQIVARAAVQSTIEDILAFGPNTSYSLTFPGPALKCNYATETQQALMDHYKTKNNATIRFINVTEFEQDQKGLQLVSLPPAICSKSESCSASLKCNVMMVCPPINIY